MICAVYQKCLLERRASADHFFSDLRAVSAPCNQCKFGCWLVIVWSMKALPFPGVPNPGQNHPPVYFANMKVYTALASSTWRVQKCGERYDKRFTAQAFLNSKSSGGFSATLFTKRAFEEY